MISVPAQGGRVLYSTRHLFELQPALAVIRTLETKPVEGEVMGEKEAGK